MIWRFMPYGLIRTEEQMAALVSDALDRQDRGTDVPFAVIHRETDRAVGGTSYLAIEPHHRSLEIGGTWYTPAHQRTGVNTECKYLLLRHAFEDLGCLRVQLKTDLRNERSQRAIERIGALREGVLRNNLVMPDGYIRSTVMYSILAEQWPGVKARLEEMLARG
jgi:RimJ/RimL family protein N-acetyltransferase